MKYALRGITAEEISYNMNRIKMDPNTRFEIKPQFTRGVKRVKENDKLYKEIFKFVTNDILSKGALSFDDIQHGEYAKTHGNFTSAEVGYRIVNRRFDIL